MNAGIVTSRVYDALKRQVMSGRLRPGIRLDPAKLADALASSTTPVRDALYQLAGERLVEARQSEGFYLPLIHEPSLRDLYAWNATLFRWATSRWPTRTEDRPVLELPTDDPERPARAVFDAAVRWTGSREYLAQVASVSDRLAASRHAEARVLGGNGTELAQLSQALEALDRRAALQISNDYHKRREKAAPLIVAELYRE